MGNFEDLGAKGLFPKTLGELEDAGVEDVEEEEFEDWEAKLDALDPNLVQEIVKAATNKVEMLRYAGLMTETLENNADFVEEIEELPEKLIRELIRAAESVRGTGGHGFS